MSKNNLSMPERYMFQMLNSLEDAFLMPVSPDHKLAYKNLRRHLAKAESARQSLSLISRLLSHKHGTITIVPTICLTEGTC